MKSPIVAEWVTVVGHFFLATSVLFIFFFSFVRFSKIGNHNDICLYSFIPCYKHVYFQPRSCWDIFFSEWVTSEMREVCSHNVQMPLVLSFLVIYANFLLYIMTLQTHAQFASQVIHQRRTLEIRCISEKEIWKLFKLPILEPYSFVSNQRWIAFTQLHSDTTVCSQFFRWKGL